MAMKLLVIDFLNIKSMDDFHQEMKRLFGFPDFYRNNLNAFIDCLNSLRYPEDGMTSFFLKEEESLLLEIYHLDLVSDDVRYDFLLSIQAINYGATSMGDFPLIYLLLNKT